MNTEVFKLQRPLGGSDMSRALVYNRDRSKEAFIPYDDEVKEFFFWAGDPPKLYVTGSFEGDVFRLGAIVVPQDW